MLRSTPPGWPSTDRFRGGSNRRCHRCRCCRCPRPRTESRCCRSKAARLYPVACRILRPREAISPCHRSRNRQKRYRGLWVPRRRRSRSPGCCRQSNWRPSPSVPNAVAKAWFETDTRPVSRTLTLARPDGAGLVLICGADGVRTELRLGLRDKPVAGTKAAFSAEACSRIVRSKGPKVLPVPTRPTRGGCTRPARPP